MIKFVILVAMVATAFARPGPAEEVPIVSYKSDLNEDGSFKYDFETGDGTKQGATGNFQPGPGPEEGTLNIDGYSSYISPEGTEIKTQFQAGPNGYNAQGAHIPTSPPIPDYILRALEYNKAHPEQDNL